MNNQQNATCIIKTNPITNVSFRSVFSKFAIHPLKDVNFGPMVINIKKQRQFYIENHGDFEFRYSIVKVSNKGLIGARGNNKQRTSTREGESGRTSSQLLLGRNVYSIHSKYRFSVYRA